MKSNVIDRSHLKAAVMSFHGTLANTELAHQAARIAAFREHGYGDIPLAAHAGGQAIAATSPAVIGRTLKKAGIIPEQQSLNTCATTREVSATADKIYKHLTRNGVEPQRGAIDAVRTMAGYFAGKMAIYTCDKKEEVMPFLEKKQLLDVFPEELVITRETILDSHLDLKPEPDGYMLAMTLMGVRERETLVIDDSPTGLAAAVASGAIVCALSWRRQSNFPMSQYVRYEAASLADIKFL